MKDRFARWLHRKALKLASWELEKQLTREAHFRHEFRKMIEEPRVSVTETEGEAILRVIKKPRLHLVH